MRLIERFSKIVSPPHCARCRIVLPERTFLCSSCYCHDIIPCVSCDVPLGRSSHPHVRVYALGQYEGRLRSWLYRKYASDRTTCYRLGVALAMYQQLVWSSYELLVPVPLHWRRWCFRGFNQAYEVARGIRSVHDIAVVRGLSKRQATPAQAAGTQRERWQNVAHAFLCPDYEAIRGKRILLVDDVMTTGATLAACAKEMYRAGADHVEAAVVARNV